MGYGAGFKRVYVRNISNVNVKRLNPTIQPRFGSFYICFGVCKKHVGHLLVMMAATQ